MNKTVNQCLCFHVECNQTGWVQVLPLISDVPAPAWPESPSFGLALGGSGFVKSQARPKAKKLAWPGLALAYQCYHPYIIIFQRALSTNDDTKQLWYVIIVLYLSN